MAERTIKVDNNTLALEVQLAVSARALGLDTKTLEDSLKERGVRLYPLLGASRTLSPEQAKRRIEVVLDFADRARIPIGSEYKQILLIIKEGGDNNGIK